MYRRHHPEVLPVGNAAKVMSPIGSVNIDMVIDPEIPAPEAETRVQQRSQAGQLFRLPTKRGLGLKLPLLRRFKRGCLPSGTTRPDFREPGPCTPLLFDPFMIDPCASLLQRNSVRWQACSLRFGEMARREALFPTTLAKLEREGWMGAGSTISDSGRKRLMSFHNLPPSMQVSAVCRLAAGG